MRVKKRNKSRDYVNNKEFQQAIVDWYASGKDEIPDVLTRAVMQIAQRLSTKHNFRNYTWGEEMRDDAIYYGIKALREKKYDPTRYDNPFAYFTMIAHNQFVKIINKEKKESYIKHKALENYYFDSILSTDHESEAAVFLNDDANINKDLIEKFEKPKKENEDE